MGIVIGAEPDSSFANPLGLLSDCHRRIEKFLQNLIVLVSHDQAETLDLDHRHSLEVALRYFREAAPRHTRDEEESLFPKMRACGGETAAAAFVAIDALEADHDKAGAAHDEIDRLGCKWLADGQLTSGEATDLHELLQSLQSLYAKHIEIEDTQIFPLAGQLLDATTIKAIGLEMAERRGIDLDKLPDLKLHCPTKRGTRIA